MKTQKLNSRLSLNKQTIANLDNEQMRQVVGGDAGVSKTCCACTHHCGVSLIDPTIRVFEPIRIAPILVNKF